jgi:dolichol-phosphate mannosyltransferase
LYSEASVAPSVQILIAALNEEKGIESTLTELKKHLAPAKVLVVDGRSVDRTVEVAKEFGAEVLFQDGKGKGDAFAKGIRNIDSEVDYVVVTDADYTYPAESIPRMIQILQTNPSVGMVCGNRFSKKLESEVQRDVFYFGNRLLAFTHNFLNGVKLADPLTGLRVIRSIILKDWQVKSKGFDIEVELNHRCERKGFSIVEVPIDYRERVGEKKLGIRHGAEIMQRILLETTY